MEHICIGKCARKNTKASNIYNFTLVRIGVRLEYDDDDS